MKRFISIIICLVMLLSLFSVPGLAEEDDGLSDAGETTETSESGSDTAGSDAAGTDTAEADADESDTAGADTTDSATGAGDTDTGEDEPQPSSNRGYTLSDGILRVTDTRFGIAAGDKDKIVSCVIESGVTSIPTMYFDMCSALESIVIPDSVTKIGTRAFSECGALASIVIPDSVTSLGSAVFIDCVALEAVRLPQALEAIPSSAFSGCKALESIVIPEGVEKIGSLAFWQCEALESVELPVSLRSVDIGAFSSVSDALNVSYAGTEAQWGEVEIASGNTALRNAAMVYAEEPAETERPVETEKPIETEEPVETEKPIETEEPVETEKPVETEEPVETEKPVETEEPVETTEPTEPPAEDLGGGEIEDTDIRWVVTGGGVLRVSGTGDIPAYEVLSEGKKEVVVTAPWFVLRDRIVKIVIEEGITGVGAQAFRMLGGVTEAVLPEGMTHIDEFAFYACIELAEIDLPSTLISIGERAFVWCPFEHIEFPAGLKSIGAFAFDINELREIVLPEGIESVGPGAFSPNEFVTELTIPASLKEIGTTDGTDGAFTALYGLETIHVAEGVESIPVRCFSHCFAVNTIELPSTIQTLGHNFIILTYGGEQSTSKLESIVVASREGYTFGGWADEDGNVFTSEEIVARAEYKGDLSAIWLKSWSEDIFTDVQADDWFYDYVRFAYQAELMVGMADATFAPGGTGTRAQVVTILYRLAGEPDVGEQAPFSDVSEGQWYSEAVTWAAQSGITAGYEDGTFHPNRAVTRQEFVTFLQNMAVYLGAAFPEDEWEDSYLADFPDADAVAAWARPAENWSVGVGLQSGSLDSSGAVYLNPTAGVTRAELATYLASFCAGLDEIYEKGVLHVYGDPGTWTMSEAAERLEGQPASLFAELFGEPLRKNTIWDIEHLEKGTEENWYYSGGFCLISTLDMETGEYIIAGWKEEPEG